MTDDSCSFRGLFHDGLVDILGDMDIHGPNEVQAEAFSSALAGRDVMVIAQTGSGKTLTFLLPIMQHLLQRVATTKEQAQQVERKPECLVLVPSRELVVQHTALAERFAAALPDARWLQDLLLIATLDQSWRWMRWMLSYVHRMLGSSP